MKIQILIALFVSMFVFSCDDQVKDPEILSKEEVRKEMQIKIDKLSKELFEGDKSMNIKDNKEKSKELLSLYAEYYNKNPKDSKSGNYMFKAGEIAYGLGKNREAIKMFRTSHDGFPGFEKRVDALYMVAFIYENKLKNKEQARYFYNFIIENFPEHKFAEDSKANLKIIDMTPEQMIEFFKNQNK